MKTGYRGNRKGFKPMGPDEQLRFAKAADFIGHAAKCHDELVQVLRDYLGYITNSERRWTAERLKELLAKVEGK